MCEQRTHRRVCAFALTLLGLSLLVCATGTIHSGTDPIFKRHQNIFKICLFDLILYVPSTIFQLYTDGSSWVEPVLSWDKCVLLKDHNAVTPVRLEPAALRSRVKHSTTEPLRSLKINRRIKNKYYYKLK